MAHVMRLSKDGDSFTVDVFILNPNQRFTPFGGSKSGLVVKKTASLITRVKEPKYGITRDTEYDVYDASVWKWFDELINWHGYKMTSMQPVEDQSEKPEGI